MATAISLEAAPEAAVLRGWPGQPRCRRLVQSRQAHSRVLSDYRRTSQCVTGVPLHLAALLPLPKMRRRLACRCRQTGLGEGRDHRGRLGWDHPPPGARHLQPHRGWPLGNLIEQVLAIPPPYRATPGRPVYVIHASDRAVLMGEENLIGSLQLLVT